MDLDIGVIKCSSLYEMSESWLLFTLVIVSTCQIEMTFCAVRIQLKGQLIRVDSLFVLKEHVVSISEIVERGSIVWIYLYGVTIVLDGCLVFLFDAESIT